MMMLRKKRTGKLFVTAVVGMSIAIPASVVVPTKNVSAASRYSSEYDNTDCYDNRDYEESYRRNDQYEEDGARSSRRQSGHRRYAQSEYDQYKKDRPSSSRQWSGTGAPSGDSDWHAQGENIVASALKYQGTPYKFGARSGDTSAFDCSSFVQRAYSENGIRIPRSSGQQATFGKEVRRGDRQPGDILYFRNPNHVAIAMGGNKMIHTTRQKGGVTVSDITPRWEDRIRTVRRAP